MEDFSYNDLFNPECQKAYKAEDNEETHTLVKEIS